MSGSAEGRTGAEAGDQANAGRVAGLQRKLESDGPSMQAAVESRTRQAIHRRDLLEANRALPRELSVRETGFRIRWRL
jgi:hypothetical protein